MKKFHLVHFKLQIELMCHLYNVSMKKVQTCPRFIEEYVKLTKSKVLKSEGKSHQFLMGSSSMRDKLKAFVHVLEIVETVILSLILKSQHYTNL